MNSVIVTFYNPHEVNDADLAYAVIVSRYKDQWVYVRHRDRRTWEIPGGKRNPGESILETAHRELKEETGASHYELTDLGVYCVAHTSFGALYFAEITCFKGHLENEIAEVAFFDTPPTDLTYPEIQPYLMAHVKEKLF